MNAEEAADEIRMYAQTSPLSTLTGRDVTVRAELAGSDNLLWRLSASGNGAAGEPTDVVIKMYMDAGWVRGRREHEAQQLFAPLGLAPQPLWFDRDAESLPRQVVGYRWVEGDAANMRDAGVRRAVAEAIARVHATDTAALSRYSPNPMGIETYWTLLQESMVTVCADLEGEPELATALDGLMRAATALARDSVPLWANAAPTLVHGEFSPENTLVGPTGVTFVDWELSGLGDPALEVARFVQGHLVDAAQQEWLAEYRAGFDAPGLADQIDVYRRLLPVEWLCLLLDGMEEALNTYGPEIREDMLALVDAVFRAATGAFDGAARPGRDAIQRWLQTQLTGGK